MKRIFASVLTVALAAVLLTGCLSMLPDGYDDEATAEVATRAVELFNARDFEALNLLFREDLQEELSPERWEENFGEQLDRVGAFKQYESSQMMGQTNEETGEEFAVAEAMIEYENGKLVHNILIDIDAKLIAYRLGIVEGE